MNRPIVSAPKPCGNRGEFKPLNLAGVFSFTSKGPARTNRNLNFMDARFLSPLTIHANQASRRQHAALDERRDASHPACLARFNRRLAALYALTFLGFSLIAGQTFAAEDQPPPTEGDLIAILKSDAAPGDKAIACKKLAIYGSSQAVPVLAPLLADKELASWARIALEVIPGPEADEALRTALPNLHGRLLIGAINSIGVRKDPNAVDALVLKLNDADAQTVAAAADALGRIGGARVAKALQHSLARAPEDARSGIAEGCIRCAEGFMQQQNSAQAVKLYDAVRKAKVAEERVLEATRGAILARGPKGVGLLIATLRSTNKAQFGIGLRTARELAGPEATRAIVTEMHRASSDRQPMLLLALAGRHDPAANPAILDAARTGSPRLRLVAVQVLDRAGDSASFPVLLEEAVGADEPLAKAATAALIRLPGAEVDSAVIDRLQNASGKTREVLVRVAAQRQIGASLPVILQAAGDKDTAVRVAAVEAIGILGTRKEIPGLVRLLKSGQDTQTSPIENALMDISSREGSSCVPSLLPLLKSNDGTLRAVGLHTLASAGGPEALDAVTAAIEDPDENVQAEAVRTLASWPNTWPEDGSVAEPLLKLARSDKKSSYQVLALRGYLQFLQGDKKLNDKQKVTNLGEVLPLLQRPEEKRLAIAVLRESSSAGALQPLMNFAGDPGISDEACSAILDLAGKDLPGVSKEERRNALETILNHSSKQSIKRKAREKLNAAE